MFKVQDAWGIVAGMFVLIMVYLILSQGNTFRNIVSGLFSGTNTLARTLQGRGKD